LFFTLIRAHLLIDASFSSSSSRHLLLLLLMLYYADQARFTMTQFGSQSAFLVVVIALSIALGLDDVETSHLSQAINVVWISICFYIGWKLLPSVPAKNTLKEDQYLLTQGFIENFRTMKNIQQHYNRGLFRFLLAVIFAEAGVNAFTVRHSKTYNNLYFGCIFGFWF